VRITNHAVERRMVPVILFMFGGGPGTLTTVLNHIKNENPIIVFTGSGRVADLISDWFDYSREAELLLSQGQTSWIANEKRMTKARGWLLGQGLVKLPRDEAGAKTLNDEVLKVSAILDLIVKYPQLRFFGLTNAAQYEQRGDRSLLHMVMSTIFDSPRITPESKLLLAIKYNGPERVHAVMRPQGVRMLPYTRELCRDARPLVYAAFFDRAEVFAELCESGWEVRHIDALIFLELHQLGQYFAVLRRTAADVHKQPLEAPYQWIRSALRRKQKALPPHCARCLRSGRNERPSSVPAVVGTDVYCARCWTAQPISARLADAQAEWGQLSLPDQQAAVISEVQTVQWRKMPFLPGWSYKVVLRLDSDRSSTLLGSVFFIVDTYKRTEDDAICAKLQGAEPGEQYVGIVISSQQARELVGVSLARRKTAGLAGLGSSINSTSAWLTVRVPSLGQKLLLQQVLIDDTVSCLPLNDEPGRMCVHSTTHAIAVEERHLLWRALCKSFHPWVTLAAEDVVPGVPWWHSRDSASTAHDDDDDDADDDADDVADGAAEGDTDDKPTTYLHGKQSVLAAAVATAGVKKARKKAQHSRTSRHRRVKGLLQGAVVAMSMADGQTDTYDSFFHELQPLLRLSWAVLTGRERLAEYLWSELEPTVAFLGTFMCSYLYYRLPTLAPDAEKRIASWGQKSSELLDHLAGIKDPRCVRAIFDEYLYFGTDEEKQCMSGRLEGRVSKFSLLNTAQRRANAQVRHALRLMGASVEQPATRLDLAILARNKVFMAHELTQQFLDDLWAKGSTNGAFSTVLTMDMCYTNTKMNMTPHIVAIEVSPDWPFGALPAGRWGDTVLFGSPSARFKHAAFTLGHLLFLSLHTYIFLSMPFASDAISDDAPPVSASEYFFWSWVVCSAANELSQLLRLPTVDDYLADTGNCIDLLTLSAFAIAAVFRIICLLLALGSAAHSGWVEDLYSYGCVAVLGIALSLGCIRTLYLISVVKQIVSSGHLTRFPTHRCAQYSSSAPLFRREPHLALTLLQGVLLIIIAKIVSNDLRPFCAVLLTVLVTFEIFGYFFAFSMEVTISHMEEVFAYVRLWMSQPDEQTYQESVGLPWWDRPDISAKTAQALIGMAFFFFAVIILTNLLIAMMSSTYESVNAQAEAEWRAIFANQVREYCEGTVLPLPWNLVENGLDWLLEDRVAPVYALSSQELAIETRADTDSGTAAERRSAAEGRSVSLKQTTRAWGRHYVWPLRSHVFDIHMHDLVDSRHKYGGGTAAAAAAREPAGSDDTLWSGSNQVGPAQTVWQQVQSRLDDDATIERMKRAAPTKDGELEMEIVNESAIVNSTSSMVAKELGVSELWLPGIQANRLDPTRPHSNRGVLLCETISESYGTRVAAIQLHEDGRVLCKLSLMCTVKVLSRC
jgi:hypothetical protein